MFPDLSMWLDFLLSFACLYGLICLATILALWDHWHQQKR